MILRMSQRPRLAGRIEILAENSHFAVERDTLYGGVEAYVNLNNDTGTMGPALDPEWQLIGPDTPGTTLYRLAVFLSWQLYGSGRLQAVS